MNGNVPVKMLIDVVCFARDGKLLHLKANQSYRIPVERAKEFSKQGICYILDYEKAGNLK